MKMYMPHRRADTPWAMTVAIAAPATPKRSPMTITRSSEMLIKQEMTRKYSGERLFPTARRIAENIL